MLSGRTDLFIDCLNRDHDLRVVWNGSILRFKGGSSILENQFNDVWKMELQILCVKKLFIRDITLCVLRK